MKLLKTTKSKWKLIESWLKKGAFLLTRSTDSWASGILEIRCPFSAKYIPPVEAPTKLKHFYSKHVNGALVLKKSRPLSPNSREAAYNSTKIITKFKGSCIQLDKNYRDFMISTHLGSKIRKLNGISALPTLPKHYFKISQNDLENQLSILNSLTWNEKSDPIRFWKEVFQFEDATGDYLLRYAYPFPMLMLKEFSLKSTS